MCNEQRLVVVVQISKVEPNMPQEEAKAHLIERLDTYVQVHNSFPHR